MNIIPELIQIFRDVLQFGKRADSMNASTKLLGAIPEFDSMAVVSIVTALEERFGFEFHDEEITAESFETLGSLAELVEKKLQA